MRVNQVYFSRGFQTFINTFSFVMFICCMILTILLPLPYFGESPGGISLQPNPDLAPPIIALCVIVPFLCGIIFYLIFRITYKKSIQEVKNEFQENVSFNLIDSETVFKWENQLEEFTANKALKKAETEKRKQENFLKIEKMKEKIIKEIAELERIKNETAQSKQSNTHSKEKNMV